jgi:hypothetical protein
LLPAVVAMRAEFDAAVDEAEIEPVDEAAVRNAARGIADARARLTMRRAS